MISLKIANDLKFIND